MSTYKKITLGNVNLYVGIEEACEVGCKVLIWAVGSHFFSLKKCKDEKCYSTNYSGTHCCDCEGIYYCLVSWGSGLPSIALRFADIKFLVQIEPITTSAAGVSKWTIFSSSLSWFWVCWQKQMLTMQIRLLWVNIAMGYQVAVYWRECCISLITRYIAIIIANMVKIVWIPNNRSLGPRIKQVC